MTYLDHDLAIDNAAAHLRNVVTDIRDYWHMLPDQYTVLTGTGHSLTPRGPRAPFPAMPGGDRLAATLPEHDSGRNGGRALPHDPPSVPSTIERITEDIASQLRYTAPTTLDGMFLYLLAHSHHIVTLDHYQDDDPDEPTILTELHRLQGTLARLVGDHEKPDPVPEKPLIERADEIPPDTMLTPSEADHVWPGIADRVKAQKTRQRKPGHSGYKLPPPDWKGRYRVETLAEFEAMKGHARTKLDKPV